MEITANAIKNSWNNGDISKEKRGLSLILGILAFLWFYEEEFAINKKEAWKDFWIAKTKMCFFESSNCWKCKKHHKKVMLLLYLKKLREP